MKEEKESFSIKLLWCCLWPFYIILKAFVHTIVFVTAFFKNPCEWNTGYWHAEDLVGDCEHCTKHKGINTLCSHMYSTYQKTKIFRKLFWCAVFPFLCVTVAYYSLTWIDSVVKTQQKANRQAELNQKEFEQKVRSELAKAGYVSSGNFWNDERVYSFIRDYQRIGGKVISVKILQQDNDARIVSIFAVLKLNDKELVCVRNFPEYRDYGRSGRITPIDTISESIPTKTIKEESK